MTNNFSLDSPDGLPTVSPTREKVDEMLEHTNRALDEVISEIPPQFGEATVEKIAINAVLAGCRPEYLPVILAAVDGMSREEFNLYGLFATTHPAWPAIVVNGPIVDEIEVNYGQNALGHGFQANATIGRTITLIAMNIGKAVPGRTDDATHGGPHKYGMCFAENEAENPWDPFHVDRGFDADTSTVSVFAAEPPHNINDHVSETAPGVLTTCADTMATIGTNLAYMNERGEVLLGLGPEHAQVIADDGWSKRDVKRFIYDQARVPYHKFKGHGMDYKSYQTEGSSIRWAKHFDVESSNQRIGLCPSPENVFVMVVGGFGRHSVWFPNIGDTTSQTVSVDKYMA